MSKGARIELRISEHEKDRLERAAEKVGMSVSEFMRDRLADDVDEVLGPEGLTVVLPADVYDELLASLDAPARTLPALAELANRPRRYRDESRPATQ